MTAPVILAFGDSNTHGTMPLTHWQERGRLPKPERWTSHLADLTGADVIAEGLPGRTTVHDDPVEGAHRNGLTALPILLESHRPIDLVIVMLGTNDLKPRFSVGPADIARALDRLLNIIATSGTGPGGLAPKSVLVSPAPVVETGLLAEIFAGAAQKSRDLPAPLAEVADLHKAAFLDAGRYVEVSPIDGVHLTAEAHETLAQALAPIARRSLGMTD